MGAVLIQGGKRMFRSGCAEGRAGGGMLRHPHARLAAPRVPAGVAEEEETAEAEADGPSVGKKQRPRRPE